MLSTKFCFSGVFFFITISVWSLNIRTELRKDNELAAKIVFLSLTMSTLLALVLANIV